MDFSIKRIAKALHISAGISLSYYDLRKEKLTILADTELNLDLLFEESGIKDLVAGNKLSPGEAQYLHNDVNCGWIILYLEREHLLYLAGPVLQGAVAFDTILRFYQKRGLTMEKAEYISEEYRNIPVIPFTGFLQHYGFIHHLLTGKTIDFTTLGLDGPSKQETAILYNDEKVYQTQQRNFRDSLVAEKYMLDCVRRGDVNRIENRGVRVYQELTALGNSELRSMKNNFITAISLVTRAAMDGGLAVELAFPLSDVYIIRLENTNHIAGVMEVYRQAVLDFTKRVKNNQFKLQYSQVINKCCGYIAANYSNPIRLSDVAAVVGLHPDYLSRRFKTETGKSVLEYIRKVRVEEAKLLMQSTDLRLTEISFKTGYSSQGKFIKDFQLETGGTPSEYRKKG